MTQTEEIEVWQFERKSFVHWRQPFLFDDPPPFVSRDKQQLNDLSEYKLTGPYVFEESDDWQIEITENVGTDCDGWIYSDHFQSRKWSKHQFSSSHLCRKRRWKRRAKKQFVAKLTKMHSLNFINEGLSLCLSLSL